MGTLRIMQGSHVGNAKMNWGWNKQFSDFVKQYPGVLWSADDKTWVVPNELVSVVCGAAIESGMQVLDERKAQDTTHELSGDLLPWQREAVERILREKTLLVNFDTGLGKTRTALELFSVTQLKTLVVCPASVRGTWLAQCERWLGSLYSYSVAWTGEDELDTSDVFIVSYEWLRKKTFEPGTFGVLIFDEIHKVKNGRADISQAAFEVSESNPQAYKVGLTATPVANKLEDLHHQFHVLSPGRFSSWMRFVKHYFEGADGTHGGYVVGDVKPEREEELRWRLNKLMIRKTKSEVAHLLPALTVNLSWHKEKTQSLSWDATTEGLEAFSRSVAPTKARIVVDIVGEKLSTLPKGGAFKICIITHLISTAETIASMLRKKFNMDDEDPVECVTGKTTAKQRGEIIKRSCLRDRSILVATMHSVGVGIDDMKVFKDVMFAELYWSPQVVIQTLGRFVRMGSSGEPVSVEMVALRGTVDESIAMALDKKISEALKVGGLGRDGELMNNAFSVEDDEALFLEMLREQISFQANHDEYGVGS